MSVTNLLCITGGNAATSELIVNGRNIFVIAAQVSVTGDVAYIT